MGTPFLKPKTLKDLKFLKHGLDQLETFQKMKPVIVDALTNVSNSTHELASTCKAYLTQINCPRFGLILSFLMDVMKPLSAFNLKIRKTFDIHENIISPK